MPDPKIRLKRSSVSGKIPSSANVPLGELALNTYDGYLYASKDVGAGTTVIAINPFRVGTGTDTYDAYFTQGNIGIGTNEPISKLDVSGEGADSAQLSIRQWNDNSAGSVIDGPDVRFFASGGTIASPAEMDNDDVIGKVNAFAYNGTSSAHYGGFGWKYKTDGFGDRGSIFEIQTKTLDESSISTKLSISEEGSVGIGTAIPINVNLQVNGFYNSGTSEYGAPTQYFLTTLSSPSAGDNIGRIIFARNGDSATIAAKSTGTADETDLYFYNRTSGGADNVNNVQNTTPTLKLYHDKTAEFASDLTIGGNLGIGTDDPGSKLGVFGDVNITGVVTATFFYGDGSNLTNVGAGPGGSDGQIQYNNGGLIGGAAQIYYDDVNNRLGINTSSPETVFDVRGTANIINDVNDPVLNLASDVSYIRDVSDGTDEGGHGIIQIGGPDGSYVISVQDGAGRIQHRWNSSTGTSPTFLVGDENAGFWEMDSQASATELFAVYHDYGTNAGGGTTAVAGDAITWNKIFNLGTDEITWRGDPDTTTTTAFNRWKVTNDQDTSTSSGASYMHLRGNSTDRSLWRLVAGDDATAGYFKIQDFSSGSWTTNLYISQSGQVGIGTDIPSTELEVNGTVTATTFSGSGASLTSLNATNLTSGTVDTARLPATYSKAENIIITATSGSSDLYLRAADDIVIEPGRETAGNIYFRGTNGAASYRFAKSGQNTIEGLLSFESLTTDRTFTFPDGNGTLALDSDLTNGSVTTIANNWKTIGGQMTGYLNDGGGNVGMRINATTGATNTLVEDGSAWEIDFENDSDVGDFILRRSVGVGTEAEPGDTISWEDQLRNEGSDRSIRLYYQGSEKLATTNTGVSITGDISATNFTGAVTGTIANASDYSTLLRSNASDTATGSITFQDCSVLLDSTSASVGPWQLQQSTGGQLQFTIASTGGPEMQLSGDGSDYTTAVLSVGGNNVLTTADEGAGNGIDADTVDGIQASSFLRSDQADTITQATSGTNTLIVENTGGFGSGTNTGARIAEFRGDSDGIVIRNIAEGDYGIYNTQQGNGIELYDGTGGVRILYNGTTGLEFDSGNNYGDFKGTPTVNGNNVLTTADESSFLKSDANDTFTGTLTAGQNGKIAFPDNTTVPDSPTNEQHDYITFGANGSISQVSGRGALMITSSDDALILANGEVGRNFTNSNINAGNESIHLCSDDAFYVYTDLQEGWGTEQTLSFNNTGTLTITGSMGVGTDSPLNTGLDVGTGSILVSTAPYGNNTNVPVLIAGTPNYTGATTNWGTYGIQVRLKSSSGGTPRLTVDTTGGEKICVENGGNIGIGTDDPNSLIHGVVGDTTTAFKIERTDAPAKIESAFGAGDASFKYTVNNAGSWIQGIDDTDSDKFKISYGSAANAAFGTNDYLTVDAVGTVTVENDLIANGGNTAAIKLNKTATTQYAGITWSEIDDARFLLYVANSADGTLNLQVRKNGTNIKQVWSVNQDTGVQNFLIAPTISNNTVYHEGVTKFTGDQLVLGGSEITAGSAAKLQVNGFMRTGDIYLHEGGSTPTANSKILRNNAGTLEWDTNEVWHAGNMGDGSTLDADKLDGQEGSFYQDASNLNAGTIPTARIADVGDSEARIITFDNLEKSNLAADGELGFDSSQGLILYRTQQGVTSNKAVTVLDAANIQAGSGINISNIGDTSPTGTDRIVFSVDTVGLNADSLDGQDGSYYLDTSSTAQTKTGQLIIDVDDQQNGALRIESNVTDADFDFYFAQEIVSTLSGTTAATGDREQGGLFIDVNSTTTGGDTTNEHKAYGIFIDLDITGDGNFNAGVWSDVTATPTTGTTSSVYGGYSAQKTMAALAT